MGRLLTKEISLYLSVKAGETTRHAGASFRQKITIGCRFAIKHVEIHYRTLSARGM